MQEKPSTDPFASSSSDESAHSELSASSVHDDSVMISQDHTILCCETDSTRSCPIHAQSISSMVARNSNNEDISSQLFVSFPSPLEISSQMSSPLFHTNLLDISPDSDSSKATFIPSHTRAISMPSSASRMVTASSYAEFAPSPAISFLASLAESSTPLEFFRLQPNTVIGKYLFLNRKSQGTFSECWHARSVDIRDDTDYAVKVLVHGDWNQELEIWKKLDHPNLLRLVDHFQYRNAKFAVTKLASGGSLLSLAEKGSLSLNRIKRIFKQIVAAANYMHAKRIVHKDLKLENVLIHRNDHVFVCDYGFSEEVPVCMDFEPDPIWQEIARLQTQRPSHEGDLSQYYFAGSLHYSAPETLCPELILALKEPLLSDEDFMQSFSLLERLKKRDTWALGVILYCLMRGYFPFNEDFAPRLKLSILEGKYEKCGNEAIDDLLDKLLEKNFLLRYDCQNILDHYSISDIKV